MGKTLTLVACAPPKSDPTTEPLPIEKETDQSTRNLLEKLAKRLRPDVDIVHRVASVNDIRSWLDHYKTTDGAFDRIQLVGHGRAGKLLLGSTYVSNPPQNGVAYYLNTTLGIYRLLADRVHASTKVYVLGCDVGTPSELNSGRATAEDGPALVFALARLWRIKVYAPVGWIDDDDFDSWRGHFERRSALTVATPERIKRVGKARQMPLIAPNKLVEMTARGDVVSTLQAALSKPLRVHTAAMVPSDRVIDLTEADSAEFAAYGIVEFDARPPLAAAESVLGIELDGENVDADVILGGQVLRVAGSGSVRLFRVIDRVREREASLAQSLLRIFTRHDHRSGE